MKCFLVLGFFICIRPSSPQTGESHQYILTGFAQGTTYRILYFSKDSLVSTKQTDSILSAIDSSLSLYKPYSLINQFNSSATGLIADKHLKKIVEKARETFSETNGIFDITVYPFTKAWGFGVKRTDTVPSQATIRSLRKCVGSGNIYWSGDKLQKKKKCIELDPNGIAQGYSVDIIADYLESRGINNYLVELGGEIRVRGRKPDGSLMKIAIEVPGESRWDVSLTQRFITIDEGAITTSGSYRKFYESKGKKISHIIDARTGYPTQNELISVTVFAKDAISADAYDNALMVMGLKKALAFVEKRKDISAHFIYYKKDGSIADTASSRFLNLFSSR